MPIQTTYTERQRRGIAGMLPNMVDSNIVTRVIESAGGVGYPVAVSQGTNENGCIVGGTVAGFIGVTIRDDTIVNSAAPDTYPTKTNVNILTRGEIFVAPIAGGVAVTDVVTFNTTTGLVSKVPADASNLVIPGARWKATYSATDLPILQLGIQR